MNQFTFTDEYRPLVELGLGDTRIEETELAGQWNVDEWNDPGALWAGTAPLWLDITDKVFELECSYGRERTTDLFAPGTATLLIDNRDGWGDPLPPDDDPAFLTLRSGRPLRISLVHDVAGTRVIWRGYIDGLEPRYDANDFEAITVSAVCALGEVGRVPLAELAVAVGSGELAGTRVARILNAAKWPNILRSIETTGVTMLPTVFGNQIADLFGVLAESVGGAIYGDENGAVVFRGRDWQMHDPDEPVHFTIDSVTGLGKAVPTAWRMSDRREDIVTQVVIGRETDAEPTTFDSETGQRLYGIETWQADDLVCSSASQLTRLASRLFRTRGFYSGRRVDGVTLNAATDPLTMGLMYTLSPFIPHRLRCRLELERGVIFDENMFVTGITHRMLPGEWECDVSLDRSQPWETVAGRWDDPYQGYWDLNTWSGVA